MQSEESPPELNIPSSPNCEIGLSPDDPVDLDNLLRVEKEMQEKDEILPDEVQAANPDKSDKFWKIVISSFRRRK
ncbi:uncharacterized protein Z518_10762 [Rhinocladiella mackenziei CBS 650.93]|uniref:Uncharacterized protein n=1 Tax=Rhinocladiella mackenziei CBS 650.93 TaxID=1442369 RepID=A0A0D2ISU8_9EURO|nr:uncharacterized protein Z518_10762 [Rhinocladiella mackenziei CBS 650.93]KIW99834.1 hypothetical protein Z518_10762 [Rhinocladiella mackenziei CBS 650.93]